VSNGDLDTIATADHTPSSSIGVKKCGGRTGHAYPHPAIDGEKAAVEFLARA
jgi:hypothetical protein